MAPSATPQQLAVSELMPNELTGSRRQRRKNNRNASGNFDWRASSWPVLGVDGGSDEMPLGKPYVAAIEQAPVTMDRIPYSPSVHDTLVDPGTARATVAATRESPNGTTENNYARTHRNQTVLQQHVEYFDPDHDRIIWPLDTLRGFRGFGWSFILSLFAMIVIHGGLSYPTVPGLFPDPCFRIRIANLHKAKHGSDSMTYDNEGRFRPQQFEDFFSKFDKDKKGGVTWREVRHALWAQALIFDIFGFSAAFLEWGATYVLLWPKDGIMKKEDVRAVYDGSIFYKKAQEHRTTRESKKTNCKKH